MRYQGGDDFSPKHKPDEIFRAKDTFKLDCVMIGAPDVDSNVTFYYAPDDSNTQELMDRVITAHNILQTSECGSYGNKWRKYESARKSYVYEYYSLVI